MNYLVIRLLEDESAQWIAVDDQGTRKSPVTGGDLAEAAAAARSRQVIVLVPSSAVLTVDTELPLKGRRLLAALPYALEETVADDIETLHFAPGRRRADGSLPVAVVSRQQMEHWLDMLATVGIEADRIVADYHGLASIPNTLSLLIAGDEVMFNDGAALAFTLPGSNPAEVIAAAGYLEPVDDSAETRGQGSALQVYCDPDAEERYAKDWALLRHELASVNLHLLPDGALPRLAVTVASGAGINLLQGRYGERTDYGSLLRPWRTAASLLLALAIVGLAGKAADYVRLGMEETALREQFTAQYRELRPNDQREILDPEATVNSIRRSIGTGQTAAPVFLPSLQVLAAAIDQNKSADIEAITYRAGVIDVRLSAPDVATLDRIQQAVSASNRFSATIQSTTQSEDGLDSRIQIRESGA